MATAGAVVTSDKGDWRTPEVVLKAVRQLGPIALDPCGGPGSIVGAAVEWSLEAGDDGLARPWKVDAPGLIYVNPEYGTNRIAPWLAKCESESAEQRREVIALVPARTSSSWFHNYCFAAPAICFWRGRIQFEKAPSGAPFPSALVYWGSRPFVFAGVFKAVGTVLVK